MDVFSIVSILVIVATLLIGAMRRFTLTYLLIMGNFVIYFFTILSFTGFFMISPVQLDLGFRPAYLTSGDNFYTIFTYMFVHSTIFHVIVNMLFLFLIGVQLESRIGKGRFAAVYFVAGFAGVLLESVIQWGSGVLIIGASAAISGAMGAMLLLYPREQTPMFLGPLFLPRVPVWMSVGSWFVIQVVMVFLDSGPIAYSAHIGGFLAGMVVGQMLPVGKRTEEALSLNVDSIVPLATTPQLRDALQMIRDEKEEDVRRVWLEYFAKKAKCPECGSTLSLRGGKLRCASCRYEVEVK